MRQLSCLILPPFMGGARGGSILSKRGVGFQESEGGQRDPSLAPKRPLPNPPHEWGGNIRGNLRGQPTLFTHFDVDNNAKAYTMVT